MVKFFWSSSIYAHTTLCMVSVLNDDNTDPFAAPFSVITFTIMDHILELKQTFHRMVWKPVIFNSSWRPWMKIHIMLFSSFNKSFLSKFENTETFDSLGSFSKANMKQGHWKSLMPVSYHEINNQGQSVSWTPNMIIQMVCPSSVHEGCMSLIHNSAIWDSINSRQTGLQSETLSLKK